MAVSAMHSMFNGLDNLIPQPPPPRTASGRRRPTTGNQPNGTPGSAPNLLLRSMLKKAVRRGVVEQEGERKRPSYSGSGHRCWSSLRTREWQDFQRMLREDGMEGNAPGHESTNSYLYFSTPRASRMSKKSIRKQLASPDSDYYNRERSKDFRRIEEALDTVKFVKHQKRQDYLSGVPNEFFKTMQDEQTAKANDKNTGDEDENHPRSPTKTEHDNQTAVQSRAMSSRPNIPGLYIFPKPSDFVPPDGTKLQSVGVDWKYSSCHREKRSSATKSRSKDQGHTKDKSRSKSALPALTSTSSSSIPGTLFRSTRAVTDGLLREGTSVSKIQGKTLGPGEWPVQKIWKRKLDGITNTLQMARFDIGSDLLKSKDSDKNEVEASKQEGQDDTMSMEAQSIDRAGSEDDNMSEKCEENPDI